MAAGAGVGGVSQGPTPWWQLPGGGSQRANLESSAPPGYVYDPVKMDYVHSPTQQGQAVNDFTKAANPALAGLLSGLTPSGGASAFGGGTGSAAPAVGGGGTAFGTSSGGGTAAPGVSGGGRLPALTLPDQSAGTDAAYATAKDKVGKSSRASLDALRSELGATGQLGGGAEGQLTRDVITSAAGNLGQVSRDQAMTGANLSADFAKTNFAGGITQRGQDVQSQEAQARLAQEARIADSTLAFQKQQAASNQQLQMLQLALSGLKGATGSTGLVY
jgi:hypothetical protein